jgi:hypothetical protein
MSVRSLDQIDSRTLARYRHDPSAFIHECLISPYDNEPYRLNDSERAFIKQAFQRDSKGRLKHPLLLYGAIKKSRKTEFAGLLTHTVMLLFGGRYAEGYIVANDQEQAVDRCFTACTRIAEASPLLRHETRITQDKIVYPATQSTVSAIASDYSSIAGGHPTISVFDEIWAFTSQRARRLFDELIPVPTRKISCRLIVTHAGFSGEGELLYELYQRGLQLPEIDTDLRAGNGMVMFWGHTPICHWQDQHWLDQMRRDLPPNQYLRMIENRFTSTEAAFISMDKWDACVRPELGHMPSAPFLPVYVGVDASVKHDSTAIVVVALDETAQVVRLVFHRVFQPTPDEPLDFEATIEKTLINLAKNYSVRKILFDPYQMQAIAQRLTREGLPIEEFPQTSANLTAATQNLFDLIQSQSIVLYPDAAMRLAVSRAVAIETPRGWRIGKDKQSHKIDVIVALGMAAYAAIQSQAEPFFDRSWNWVSGPSTDEAERIQQEKEDENLRFNNFLRANGAFGWP